MPLLDEKTSRVLFTILVFAGIVGFVWAARKTIIVFLFAIFFAYLIAPLVEQVRKLARTSRGKAIVVVYTAIFAAVVILFLFIGPNIIREAQKLSDTIPDLYGKIASGQIAWTFGSQHGWSYETTQKVQYFLASHRQTIVQVARAFGTKLADFGKNAWWLVLIPILAAFFLKDAKELRDAILDVFERRTQRELVEGLLQDVDAILAHFIRAQLILAALTGVVFSIALTIMRVPYGYVMGVLGGFLEFIPVVGPLLAALLIMVVALGTGYRHLLVLLIFLGVWRAVQDYVNAPRIMGRQVKLPPLAALFGVLAGAEVGGVVGVYLSIPTMASLRIFWRRWRAYQANRVCSPEDEILTIPEQMKREPKV